MNIVKIEALGVVIDCKACEKEVLHPFEAMTILDEYSFATGKCPTPTCGRFSSYPRQRPDEDPAGWDWDHNRAMNDTFQRALRAGAKIQPTMSSVAKANLLAEKSTPRGKRFPGEHWKDFSGTGVVKRVRDERQEK